MIAVVEIEWWRLQVLYGLAGAGGAWLGATAAEAGYLLWNRWRRRTNERECVPTAVYLNELLDQVSAEEQSR
jgi:hypothetical protein